MIAQYKFVNVRRNWPVWRFSDEKGVYRYDPIFMVHTGVELAYWVRNLQPEAIVRVG